MSIKNTSETENLLATGEQVEHIMDMWRRRLKGRKLTREEANQLIQNGGQYLPVMDKAADVLVDQVRSDMTNTIVRLVKNIRRGRTAQQAIDATGRKPYLNQSVLDKMPVGAGPEEVEMVYFHFGHRLTPAELANEYETGRLKDLIPDSQAQAADNEADPAFADEHPNAVQWQDAIDGPCCAAFNRWNDERSVYVRRDDRGWSGRWWFGGRRK